jgi:anhydro-N-acetylmuramic acid kinase
MTLYLGMMSGTSMDGIDAALLEIGSSRMNVQAAHNHAWPAQLQQRLRHAAEHSEQIGEPGARDRQPRPDAPASARG